MMWMNKKEALPELDITKSNFYLDVQAIYKNKVR